MKTSSIGFIGGGRITKIVLQAFANCQRDFESIVVYDRKTEVTTSLKKIFPVIEVVDTIQEASKQSIVFIALHPPVIMEALDQITNSINTNTIVISFAPKITIDKIFSKLNTQKIARIIPNATSYINKGYNPIAFAKGFDTYEKVDVLALFMHLGNTFEVKESTLEAYALISAMLPTYFWFQWKEIAKLGTKMGLTPNESNDAISKTLEASIEMLFYSKLSNDEVMDLIPVKPMAECEGQIIECYEQKLMGLFEKIKP